MMYNRRDKPQEQNSQGRHSTVQPSQLSNNNTPMFPNRHQQTPALKAQNHAESFDDCSVGTMEEFLV